MADLDRTDKTLLIVYHTQSGASGALARAAWRGGLQEAGVEVRVLRAWDADTEALAGADGLLLVAAENSGALSGAMKDFLDRTFYPAIDRGLVLPCAIIISAGNDGRGAERQFERILSGYPFPVAAEPLILRGAVTAEYESAALEMGQAFAAGLAMGIY
jgi:multimeric flavodoxin WrbA